MDDIAYLNARDKHIRWKIAHYVDRCWEDSFPIDLSKEPRSVLKKMSKKYGDLPDDYDPDYDEEFQAKKRFIKEKGESGQLMDLIEPNLTGLIVKNSYLANKQKYRERSCDEHKPGNMGISKGKLISANEKQKAAETRKNASAKEYSETDVGLSMKKDDNTKCLKSDMNIVEIHKSSRRNKEDDENLEVIETKEEGNNPAFGNQNIFKNKCQLFTENENENEASNLTEFNIDNCDKMLIHGFSETPGMSSSGDYFNESNPNTNNMNHGKIKSEINFQKNRNGYLPNGNMNCANEKQDPRKFNSQLFTKNEKESETAKDNLTEFNIGNSHSMPIPGTNKTPDMSCGDAHFKGSKLVSNEMNYDKIKHKENFRRNCGGYLQNENQNYRKGNQSHRKDSNSHNIRQWITRKCNEHFKIRNRFKKCENEKYCIALKENENRQNQAISDSEYSNNDPAADAINNVDEHYLKLLQAINKLTPTTRKRVKLPK